MDSLLNGQACDQLPLQDRGLLYGDGCFSTLAVYQGHPLAWRAHWERLIHCADRLAIPPPSYEALLAEVRQLAADQPRAVLKIILTRGSGGRGYQIPPQISPSRLVLRHPWPDYPAAYVEQGIALTVCQSRLARNPSLTGIKHLNRLEQILGRREWGPPYAEGLMLDTQDNVISGTFTNVFFARQGKLFTPALHQCGIAGVMRAILVKTAILLGIPVESDEFSLDDLCTADEILVCNSLIGLWPVRLLHLPASFQSKSFSVGPIACALRQSMPAQRAIVPYSA